MRGIDINHNLKTALDVAMHRNCSSFSYPTIKSIKTIQSKSIQCYIKTFEKEIDSSYTSDNAFPAAFLFNNWKSTNPIVLKLVTFFFSGKFYK